MNIFLSMIKEAIDNKISLEDFVQWFEDWYNDESKNSLFNEKDLKLLEELYSDVGYFEPQEELRKEHSCYYGNEVLIHKLKSIAAQLSL